MESNGSGLTIRGLKKKEAPVVEKPYDPFGGVDLTPSRYVLQENYDNEWLGNFKNEPRHMVEGTVFRNTMQELCSRHFQGWVSSLKMRSLTEPSRHLLLSEQLPPLRRLRMSRLSIK